MPVEVHGDDGADRRHARGRAFQDVLQRGRVHGVVDGVDVDQQRRRAGHLDRGNGGDGGVGHGDDRAAAPDAQAAQRQGDGIGAVAAADHGGNAQPSGELGLEGADFVAEDIPAGRQRARNRVVDLVFQRMIAGAWIGLRDHSLRVHR